MPNLGYGAGRDAEHLSRLDEAIRRFTTLYEADTSPDRKTIILFPGGMGSQLVRAHTPHMLPPFTYYTSWLACNIILGEARNLQLLPGGVDHDQTYVVPDHEVDFVNIDPYADFAGWCAANWIHLFVFGWDWRRGVQDTVDFFLNAFLPRFESRFPNGPSHPLNNFTIVGHSAGGMTVKVIANQTANPYVQRMKRAITVASPFYGYGSQIHRFLVGEPDLNWTLGGPRAAGDMASIISTMPGGYEYLYLDKATYDANAAAFANDPEGYNLPGYPSMDKADPAEAADPYNPLPDAQGRVRYPANYSFNVGLLHDGLAASRKVSSPLDRSVATRFYCIRGVQAKNGNRLQETVVSQRWARVPPQFDADRDTDPIDDGMGFGDGVQPAWGARLLGLPDPARQVITIVDDIDHMTMMNAPSVQTEIARLLDVAPRTPTAVEMPAPVATRDELNKFLDAIRQLILDKERTQEDRRTIITSYVRQYKTDELHGLMARAYIDALKSPSQKVSRPAPPKPGKETRETPPRRGGARGKRW